MSEYEGHRGKLTPTTLDPLELLDIEGYTFDDDESVEYNFNDCFYRGKYIMIDNKVYQIDDNEYDDTERMDATLQEDGTITYDVYFYNGGCGFTEALEEVINKARGE